MKRKRKKSILNEAAIKETFINTFLEILFFFFLLRIFVAAVAVATVICSLFAASSNFMYLVFFFLIFNSSCQSLNDGDNDAANYKRNM